MNGRILAVLMALAALALFMPASEPASAQVKQQLKPTVPSVQRSAPQAAPRREVPGAPQQQAPTQPGTVYRTHCNGTCMCTGDDCKSEWAEAYCKEGTQTCSGNTRADRICTCIKKAKQ